MSKSQMARTAHSLRICTFSWNFWTNLQAFDIGSGCIIDFTTYSLDYISTMNLSGAENALSIPTLWWTVRFRGCQASEPPLHREMG